MHTVSEQTLSRNEVSSCGSISAHQPPDDAVLIECLTGQAAQLYLPSSATTGASGLIDQDDIVYRITGATVGLVGIPGSGAISPLGRKVLGTVQASAGSC